MNGSDLLLTASVSSPTVLDAASGSGLAAKAKNIQSNDNKSAEAKKTEKVAKEFESVLLSKVLDEMKNTIGNGLGDEEPGSEQVKGMFYMYLAHDMADKGGLGLWKDLNRFFNDMQKTNTPAQSLDEKL